MPTSVSLARPPMLLRAGASSQPRRRLCHQGRKRPRRHRREPRAAKAQVSCCAIWRSASVAARCWPSSAVGVVPCRRRQRRQWTSSAQQRSSIRTLTPTTPPSKVAARATARSARMTCARWLPTRKASSALISRPLRNSCWTARPAVTSWTSLAARETSTARLAAVTWMPPRPRLLTAATSAGCSTPQPMAAVGLTKGRTALPARLISTLP